MRLSDLLGHPVVTEDGRPLGRVHDVRLVQDGPVLGTWGAAFRVDALLVGPGSLAARLGLLRADGRPPDLLRRIPGVRSRLPVEVAWDRVRDVGEVVVVRDVRDVAGGGAGPGEPAR